MSNAASTSPASIIDELNGDVRDPLPPVAPGDSPLEHDAPRESQLTVRPVAAPAGVKGLDAVHSKKAGGLGYRVGVKGDYVAESPTGRGKITKPFEIEVNLPALDGALSVIKNHLLDKALKKKYPDALKARGAGRIVYAYPLSDALPETRNLQYMDRNALAVYVAQVRAPIDVAAYPDVVDLRDAIIDWTQTPNGFEAREAAKMSKQAISRDVAALNPDLEG